MARSQSRVVVEGQRVQHEVAERADRGQVGGAERARRRGGIAAAAVVPDVRGVVGPDGEGHTPPANRPWPGARRWKPRSAGCRGRPGRPGPASRRGSRRACGTGRVGRPGLDAGHWSRRRRRRTPCRRPWRRRSRSRRGCSGPRRCWPACGRGGGRARAARGPQQQRTWTWPPSVVATPAVPRPAPSPEDLPQQRSSEPWGSGTVTSVSSATGPWPAGAHPDGQLRAAGAAGPRVHLAAARAGRQRRRPRRGPPPSGRRELADRRALVVSRNADLEDLLARARFQPRGGGGLPYRCAQLLQRPSGSAVRRAWMTSDSPLSSSHISRNRRHAGHQPGQAHGEARPGPGAAPGARRCPPATARRHACRR